MLRLFNQRDQRALSAYATITENAQPLPLFPGSSKVVRELGRNIEKVLLGEMTPEKALNDAASAARKIIK